MQQQTSFDIEKIIRASRQYGWRGTNPFDAASLAITVSRQNLSEAESILGDLNNCSNSQLESLARSLRSLTAMAIAIEDKVATRQASSLNSNASESCSPLTDEHAPDFEPAFERGV